VRRGEDVGVVLGGERLEQNSVRRNARAEQGLRVRERRADQAADEAGRCGERLDIERAQRRRLHASEHEVTVVERHAAVRAGTDRQVLREVDLEDQRLDEDLAARLIEALDDVLDRHVVAAARHHDQRVRRLVADHADLTLERGAEVADRARRRRRRVRLPAALRTGGTTTTRLRALPHRRVQRRGELLGERVLERVDADRRSTLGVEGDIEALDQRLDAVVTGLARHDDQRVRAVIDEDLRRHGARDVVATRRRLPRVRIARVRGGALALRLRTGGTRTRGDAEDLVELRRELRGIGVLHGDRVDAVAAARDIDRLREGHHVPHLARVVGDDQHRAGGLDVAGRRADRIEGAAQGLDLRVRRPQDVPDHLVLVRRRAVLVDRDRLALRGLALDDPQHVALRHHREAHRRQRDEEHVVRLGGAHLVRRHHRDLLAGRDDARIEDEVLAGEAHRPRDEILQLGLGLERDGDLPRALLARIQRLVLGRRRGATGRRGLRGRIAHRRERRDERYHQHRGQRGLRNGV
jgi:hypothetical protein